MRHSLAGVCMAGSHAPHARQIFSFIGCRRVESTLALTSIESSWILAISSDKTRRTLVKEKWSKNSAPPALTGQQILDRLNSLERDPERLGYFKGYNSQHAWTHKTCLWDLPYFKDFLLPHNIDMMHTEKNIVEAIFGTLFGIEGKSKDNPKARDS